MSMNAMSTIVAQATPVGTGAIAIVRMSGPQSQIIAKEIIQKESWGKISLNWLHDSAGQKIDEALVLSFDAPNSFTGEDQVEFQVHGNQLIVNRVIEACLYYGAELAQAGEFSQRAFLNGKMQLTEAESIADLIHAKSEKLLNAATNQFEGRLHSLISDLERDLVGIMSSVQASIDFPMDTEDQTIDEDSLIVKIDKVKDRIQDLLNSAKTSSLLRNGIKTAIVGKPNVGKSSLLNYLVKEDRALVSDIAGTTRDFISEQILIRDIPINLIDTAGISEHTDDEIEKAGIKKSKEIIAQSDLILLVYDLSQGWGQYEEELLNRIELDNPNADLIIIGNKLDIQNCHDSSLIRNYSHIQISTRSGTGFDLLYELLEKFAGVEYLAGDFDLALTGRQAICLKASLNALNEVCMDDLELMSSSIQEAVYHLHQITGQSRFDPEASLDKVFENFCIGK